MSVESVRALSAQGVGELLAPKLDEQNLVEQIVDEGIDGEAFLESTQEDWVALGFRRGTTIRLYTFANRMKEEATSSWPLNLEQGISVESVRALSPQGVGELVAAKLGMQDLVTKLVNESMDGEAFLASTKEDWSALGLRRGTAIKLYAFANGIKAASIRGLGQDVVSQAFFGPYVGDKRPLQLFLSQLQSYAAKWDPSRYHSPYTSLVQSSGWGKSRAIYQLGADMGVYVVYCSFLPADGFPKRTPHVANIFQEGFTSLRGVAYLIASAEVVAQSGLDPAAWMEKQMKQADEVGKMILDRYHLLLRQLDANSADGKLTADLKAALAKVHGSGGLKLVYAFDEANLMTNWPDCFLELTRSLRLLPAKTLGYIPSCFALFCGTSSKVASYCPRAIKDESTKVAKKGSLLFPPLRIVSRPDTFVLGKTKSDTFLGKRKRDSSVPLGFMYGRPMWGAFAVRGMSAEELVGLAVSKMLGGEQIADLSKGEAAVTPALAAALFGVSVGSTVVSSSSLVQDMVDWHMSTLVWVSDDRKLLRLCPTSEPVLGEAVARLFIMHSYLRPSLTRLLRLCDDGLVVKGVRGELVARIIVLLAMYGAAQGTGSAFFTTPVRVADFFKALLGREAAAMLENDRGPASRTFADGKMRFNHFLPMTPPTTHGMPQEKLRSFYERSAAFMFGEGEFGMPISVESESEAVTNYEVCDVQVKNLRDAHSPNPSDGHAGISLVMCFSSGQQRIEVNGSEVVVIGGPELFPCASGYEDLLLHILESRLDVQLEKLLTGDELEVAKNLVPQNRPL